MAGLQDHIMLDNAPMLKKVSGTYQMGKHASDCEGVVDPVDDVSVHDARSLSRLEFASFHDNS
jgi:hypothetical protein